MARWIASVAADLPSPIAPKAVTSKTPAVPRAGIGLDATAGPANAAPGPSAEAPTQAAAIRSRRLFWNGFMAARTAWGGLALRPGRLRWAPSGGRGGGSARGGR